MFRPSRPGPLVSCLLVLSAVLFAGCSGDEGDRSEEAVTTSDAPASNTIDTTDTTVAVIETSDSTMPPAVVEPVAMGEITDAFLASAPLPDGECGTVAASIGATRLTDGSLPEFDAWATSIENGEIEEPASDPNDPQLNIGDLASFGAYNFDFSVLARGDVDRDGLSDALVWIRCQHGGWAGKYPLTIYLSSETAPREVPECYYNYFDSWMYAEFQQTNIQTPGWQGNTYPDKGPMFLVRRTFEDWDYSSTFWYLDASGTSRISSVESCDIGWDPNTKSLDVYAFGWGG